MMNTVVSNSFIYCSDLFQLQVLPGIKLGSKLELTHLAYFEWAR